MINLEDLGDFDNLEDLNRELQKRMKIHNQSGVEDFNGLSPEQMHELQQNFPMQKSILMMNELTEKQLKECPLLVQVRLLIDKMKGGKVIKLTKTGSLPTKLVKDIYALSALKNDSIEKGITKLTKERDAEEISITRILLEISSLVKKRNGQFSLTRKGEKNADDGNFILKEILIVLFHKFNWAYFDGYGSEAVGRVNPAFSLFLLKKYGTEKRSSFFYAEKYFKAFPQLLEQKESSFRCYALRTFERYFKFIGLVDIEKNGILDPAYLKKTAFLDQLFTLHHQHNQ